MSGPLQKKSDPFQFCSSISSQAVILTKFGVTPVAFHIKLSFRPGNVRSTHLFNTFVNYWKWLQPWFVMRHFYPRNQWCIVALRVFCAETMNCVTPAADNLFIVRQHAQTCRARYCYSNYVSCLLVLCRSGCRHRQIVTTRRYA